MILGLAILQYFFLAVVDGLDKFLISKRKIFPASYTFWTVVTGAAVLIAWPWIYQRISVESVVLNVLSGVLFALTMYVFFRALSEGEVSRVVPFVFGLVPVIDLFIGLLTGRNVVGLKEIAAIFLLVPGALLISYQKKFLGKHVALKILSALLFSIYFAFWQFSAQTGDVINSFMWNRLGAAAILIVLLVFPIFRKAALKHEQVEKKKNTAGLFVFKQALGGGAFILYSWLLAMGNIAVINSLQGFRYVFLFLGALALSGTRFSILKEQVSKGMILQKTMALVLIFLGTILLFI